MENVETKSVTELPQQHYGLRPWQPTDAASMQQHLNNPNVGQYMADWYPASGYTLAMAEHWATVGHAEHGDTNWAITFNNEAIGSAGIHPQRGFAGCNVEIGYWLSELHWGRGLGTSVVQFLTKRAFEIAGMTRVFAPIHAHNKASQRICEKNGFVFEGLRRLSVMKSGQAIDSVVWAAYKDQWQQRHN